MANQWGGVPAYALAIKPSEAVKVMKSLGDQVTWSPKLKMSWKDRDKGRFCEYHNDVGHTMEQCIAL